MVSVLLLLGITLLLTYPAFTIILRNTVVLVGDSTAFGCNSSEPITWRHTNMSHHTPGFIYRDKHIQRSYSDWGFRMGTTRQFGERSLIIENVATVLAGKYTCMTDVILEKELATELIVLEEHPECSTNLDEFVGPNNCSIPPDEVQLSCSVSYRGNKSPKLKWRKFGDSGDLESTCTTEHASHRKTCKLTVEPDLLLNGSIFVCRTIERASDEQYNCTTKPIVILHSFSDDEAQTTDLSEGDTVECTANSSQSCTYKWVWYEMIDGDLSRTIESTNHVLTARKIGLHRCEARYELKNQKCIVFPKFVNVIPSEKNLNHNGKRENDTVLSSSERLLLKKLTAAQKSVLKEENEHWTPSIIGLLILGILPYVAFACYLFTRMRRKGIFARDRIPTCMGTRKSNGRAAYVGYRTTNC